MKKIVLLVMLLVSFYGICSAEECKHCKSTEQLLRKYGTGRDERKDVWVYDSKQYGVMWYGYYSSDGHFNARFQSVSPLADFRSLYPTNYRKYYESQPTVPVRFKGAR